MDPPVRRPFSCSSAGDDGHISRHRFCQPEAKQICSSPMRTALLLMGLLAVPAWASQPVWKWVDGDGVTHYSDRPVPGATRVEIYVGNSDSRPAPLPSIRPNAPTPPVDTGPSYRSFAIGKPVNDQNFVNTGGQVAVNVRLDPALQPGHQLILFLDGRQVEGLPRGATQFDLKEVPRGTHTVSAQIVDGRGTRLQETAAVTFHVRQQSIAQPPGGPGVRPPPKPQPRRTK